MDHLDLLQHLCIIIGDKYKLMIYYHMIEHTDHCMVFCIRTNDLYLMILCIDDSTGYQSSSGSSSVHSLRDHF